MGRLPQLFRHRAGAGGAPRRAADSLWTSTATATPSRGIELGYLLTGAALRTSDAALDASGVAEGTSIRALAAREGALSALVRGPASLGALLAEAGYRAVPSPAEPAPAATDPYFNGGYSTVRHGSQPGGAIDGIQAELPGPGVRNTPAERARTAGVLARQLGRYLQLHYAAPLPAPCR